MEIQEHIKMDYDLPTAEERVKKVEEIIANTPSEKLTPYYLEKMAEYITEPITKEEKKEKLIITKNHMKNVRSRETSFEGLVGKLENGEDGIYNMIANDKNIIFNKKKPISDQEYEQFPLLKEYKESISKLEEKFKTARGQKAFLIKKQIIEMYQALYEMKKSFNPPIYSNNPAVKSISKFDLSDYITIGEDGLPHNRGYIDFFNEEHISLLLCNYSKLKEECWEKVQSDLKWMMEDFDGLVARALEENYPMYYDIVVYKIDGKQNTEIQELLYEDYGIKHSVEYISSLWRNKIPKVIAETAVNEYLVWYYTNEAKGKWKRCSRCGQIKLAHNNFFSKNSTSKDGFYSICKCCRNKKTDQKKKIVKE